MKPTDLVSGCCECGKNDGFAGCGKCVENDGLSGFRK